MIVVNVACYVVTGADELERSLIISLVIHLVSINKGKIKRLCLTICE